MRFGLAILGLSACAHRGGLPMPGPVRDLGRPVGHERAGVPEKAPVRGAVPLAALAVAEAAGGYVGQSKLVAAGRTWRWDCSGLVAAAHAQAGRPVDGSSEDLFQQAKDLGVLHHRRRPTPGDVAFFDNTYDRDGNGRRDDRLTHVAVVETVEPDGTVVLVHKGGRGVTRIRMNLRHPDEALDPEGRVWNDGLRAGSDDGGPRLTGELWRAWGSFWAAEALGEAVAEP